MATWMPDDAAHPISAEGAQAGPFEAPAFVARFGALSPVMLAAMPLAPAWRLNFLANFFTGPLYARLGAEADLSRPEFVVLYCLSQAPGLVARDVSTLTGLPKNSISRAVSALLARGLVVRDAAGADRRAKPLALTGKGTELLASVLPAIAARQDAMRAVLNQQEAATFDALLAKMIAAMPGWVDGPESPPRR